MFRLPGTSYNYRDRKSCGSLGGIVLRNLHIGITLNFTGKAAARDATFKLSQTRYSATSNSFEIG